ncbi:MAG: RND transporter, partial [Campylobacterota bacterium]|nr:RND transporter [Campylobacterota bacterium]
MHQKLESFMGKAGGFIHDNPIKVILMVLALLAFPISNLPKITMDTSTEGFMHDDDPVLLKYNAFRAQFGRDERVAVAIKSDKIFSLEFFNTLKA